MLRTGDWFFHWTGWNETSGTSRSGRRAPNVDHRNRALHLESVMPTTRIVRAAARAASGGAKVEAERLYWYSLIELDPARPAIEGFHVDEHEYHLGLVTWNGCRKPAFNTMHGLLRTRLDGATSRESPSPQA